MKGKGWSPFDKARGLSKNQLLIGGLAGLLLLVVAIPTEQGRKQEPKQDFTRRISQSNRSELTAAPAATRRNWSGN